MIYSPSTECVQKNHLFSMQIFYFIWQLARTITSCLTLLHVKFKTSILKMRVPVTRPCLSRPLASPWIALRRPDLSRRTSLVKRPLPTKSTLRPEGELDKKLLDLEDGQSVKNESSGILRMGVKEKTPLRDIGVFWLCFTNVVVFVLDHVFQWKWMSQLYLYHASPRWWQFVTSAFCHASWEHLSSNLFLLYVFGKLVEEQEGAIGVWCAYIICALGKPLQILIIICVLRW